MHIDLNGARFSLEGEHNPVAEAAVAALAADGGVPVGADTVPDILLLSLPLLPREDIDVAPLLALARRVGDAMATRGSGRILLLASAAAAVPMRRFPAYSAQMAMAAAETRTLAMRLGPKVLVNAIGAGAIGDPEVAGDRAMLGHASVKRAGTVDEVVATVLFFCDPLNTYTTGQVLPVDGGWSVGYARNF